MAESWTTRFTRWRLNLYPAYWGTGARCTYIAHDWANVRIKLPLNWRTRNVVGVTFGGSLYASVDPIFMLMLIQRLGEGYIVWDKAASIRFRRPGRTHLYASFHLSEEELETIRTLLKTQRKVDRVYRVDLVDEHGLVHADVEKVLHIRRRDTDNSPFPAKSEHQSS